MINTQSLLASNKMPALKMSYYIYLLGCVPKSQHVAQFTCEGHVRATFRRR